MPNQPKTPTHSIRVPNDVWAKAQTKARAEGISVSAAIRRFLEEYVK